MRGAARSLPLWGRGWPSPSGEGRERGTCRRPCSPSPAPFASERGTLSHQGRGRYRAVAPRRALPLPSPVPPLRKAAAGGGRDGRARALRLGTPRVGARSALLSPLGGGGAPSTCRRDGSGGFKERSAAIILAFRKAGFRFTRKSATAGGERSVLPPPCGEGGPAQPLAKPGRVGFSAKRAAPALSLVEGGYPETQARANTQAVLGDTRFAASKALIQGRAMAKPTDFQVPKSLREIARSAPQCASSALAPQRHTSATLFQRMGEAERTVLGGFLEFEP